MKPCKTGAPRLVLAAASAMLLAGFTAANAQSVDSVLEAEKNRIGQSRQSQQRIDRIVEQTRSLVDEYRAINKEIDGLKIYNRLMEAQTNEQQQRLDEVQESLEQANVINRQIFPLMQRMIAGLEEFVELDIPFLMGERTERIQTLKDLMDEPNVSVAEKFRKVMEAFQIEIDYGRTIETYNDTVELPDGGTRDVQFLRIGRVALLYQSADTRVTGAWDHDAKQFVPVNDFRTEVKKGLRIANEQIAPELVMVPVPPPEET